MAIKYLAGDRLIGTAAERAAMAVTSYGVPAWVELGRTTTTSSTDTIDVSSFANKPYLMVLGHYGDTGGSVGVRNRFNSDSGSNYSWRTAWNGSAGSGINQNHANLFSNTNNASDEFQVFYITNKSTEEKLVWGRSIGQYGTGSGVPNRGESAAKWTNTSDPITSISGVNMEGGSIASGSEIIVLGHDPADTATAAGFWQLLGQTTLGSDGDQIDVSFTAKRYLMVEVYFKANGLTKGRMRFNDDSGTNYTYRAQVDGAATEAGAARAEMIIDNHNTTNNETYYCNMMVANVSGMEKLCITSYINNDEDSAGNPPKRGELVNKWANTSAQISKVSVINPESGSYRSGSAVRVWGSD